MRSGFVSIVGRPNVGKSTLLNKILKQKVSIVCDKSQTTRNNIKGIYNDPDSQIIFIDTPGIHKPKVKLGEEMNNMAISSTKDVDLIIYMVDCGFSFSKDDEDIINKVNNKEIPTIIVFNKIDLARITRVNELKEKYNSLLPNATQVEIVAKDGFNVDSLLTLIKDKLPEGPRYYDENEVTDNDEVFLIKEIIREKALYVLSDEVPHCVAVYMNNIEWEENPISIDATIIVEKDSQKGIVIGANGKRIKEISTKARQSIEALLKKHVFIRIQVKVKEDWRNNDSALQEFGYKTKKEK